MSPKSRTRFSIWLLLGLWAELGCGYRPLYGQPNSKRFSVETGQVLVAEPLATQAALSGVRSELAAAGRLGSGSDYPRLVVDVLRVDEVSRRIYVAAGQPHAAGMGVAVVVRGRLFNGEAGEPALDTGDLRRAAQVAGDSDPRRDSAGFDAALRAAAERSGRAVARAALGIPEPSDEAP